MAYTERMMDNGAIDHAALNAYQFRLPTFEGPLDILLRLIEREQLAITDVSLVAVTDQFLDHLAQLHDQPPALIADFAAIGGRLVLLKSRSLLPRPATTVEEPEPEDLVRQLEEYRALRAASEQLAIRDRRALGGFARGEGVALPDAPAPRLAIHQPSILARALRRRLTNAIGPVQVVASRPIVTLREMTERLLTGLHRGNRSFLRFRATCASREEVLVGFLALLVLVRRRVMDADQETLFGDITLTPTPAMSTNPAIVVESIDESSP